MKRFCVTASLFVVMLSSSLVFAEVAKPKTVLVTGASSGIGLRITQVLSENGFLVYAGARKEKDLKRLEAMQNVESIRLDVTVQSDIDEAVALITKKGRGLDGLVNNAGITTMGPLIEVPISELEWVFNVNVFGPYRVTQAFAPLIIESQGRIVTTSSITGIFAGSMSGQYSMSKHAVEAFVDSLAVEMERFGVKVSAIEPGTYASNSGKTAAQRLKKNKYWSEKTAYKDELALLKLIAAREPTSKDPLEVANAVMHALTAEAPKRRYLVVPDAYTAELTINKAIERLLQLNQQHPYSMSRDKLVKLLDKNLGKSK